MGAIVSKESCRGRMNPAVFLACVATLFFACLFVPSRAQAQARSSDASLPGSSEHRDQKERAPDRTGASGPQTCPDGYVRIEAGAFTMGSPTGEEGRDGDETQHSVTISRAYCMKATEVTQGEWQAVMRNNPSKFKRCGANCPVEQVSWDDAVGYANALSRREGLPECYSSSTLSGITCEGYRLPTEAEWEYAARAGTTDSQRGDLASLAFYDRNAGGTTHRVRQKRANVWGLFDMLGNVREWTGDWYAEYTGAVTDPTGAAVGGSHRVTRGGAWGASAQGARESDRGFASEDDRFSALGFRLAKDASDREELAAATSAPKARGSSSGTPELCPAGYVRIASGSFIMGSPNSEGGRYDDEAQHRVTITRAFCMHTTEVTQGEWQAVMGSNPSRFAGCGSNCPVEQVSWEDTVRFANALSRREGLQECYRGSDFVGVTCTGYRLPTEAEWEYAARAGTTTATYAERSSVAWFSENGGNETHPVGEKRANAWGLHDMLGNVWEWTSDWYCKYPTGSVSDPTAAQAGPLRVNRGGSWSRLARLVRAATRGGSAPGIRDDSLGFRLVRTAP